MKRNFRFKGSLNIFSYGDIWEIQSNKERIPWQGEIEQCSTTCMQPSQVIITCAKIIFARPKDEITKYNLSSFILFWETIANNLHPSPWSMQKMFESDYNTDVVGMNLNSFPVVGIFRKFPFCSKASSSSSIDILQIDVINIVSN